MTDVPLRIHAEYQGQALATGIRNVQTQLKGLESSIKSAFSLIGVGFGAKVFLDAADAIYKFKGSLQALESQTQSVGISSKALLRNLQDITKGQVSLRDLTNSANSAIALLGEESIPRFGELAEVAMKASTALGTDLTQAFADIVKGIGRQSRLILDNLGLIIDTEAAYKSYAATIGKTAKELTEAEKKQAFLNATIEQGKAKFGGIEAAVNPTKQLNVALRDLADTLVMKVSAGLGGSIQGLSQLLETLNRKLQSIPQAKVDALIKALEGLAVGGVVYRGGMWIQSFMNSMIVGLPLILAKWRDIHATLHNFFSWYGSSAWVLIERGNSFTVNWFASFGSIIGKLTPMLVLLSGIIVTLGENFDNLKNSGVNLLASVLNLFKAFGNLLGIAEPLKDFLNSLASIAYIVGEGFVTVTGAVNVLTGGLRDLTAGIKDGKLEWKNFSRALEDSLDNIIAVTNKIRELFGLKPINYNAQFNEEVRARSMGSAGIDLINGMLGPPRKVDRNSLDDIRKRLEDLVVPPVVPSGGGGKITPEEIDHWAESFRQLQIEAAKSALKDRVHDFLDLFRGIGKVHYDGISKLTEFFNHLPTIIGKINDGITNLKQATESFLEGIGIYSGEKQAQQGALKGWFLAQPKSIQTRLAIQGDILNQPGFENLKKLVDTFGFVADKIRAMFNLPPASGTADERPTWGGAWKNIGNQFGDMAAKSFDNMLSRSPGGKQLKGLGEGMSLLSPITSKWGSDIAAQMFPGEGAMWAGPIGSLIVSTIGFVATSLFGKEKPLEIEQPVDIRIVDIETRLANFFNFRGLNNYVYSPKFAPIFEGGLVG